MSWIRARVTKEWIRYHASSKVVPIHSYFRSIEFFPIILLIAVLFYFSSGYQDALAFIMGALFSVLAGYFGMMIATRSNARTTWGATKSIGTALDIAFSGGAVMGLTVCVLGLLGLSIVYLNYGIETVSYYSLGASFVALFARVGGGIYTKAADVGADIVGKVEANLPEDDPRNPAVIADNVGDNVGDVAGMGADLYESYVGSIFSGIALGYAFFGEKGIVNTFYIVAFGLIASILSIVFVKVLSRLNKEPSLALRSGTILSSVVFLILSFSYGLAEKSLGLFWVVLVGNIVGVLIGLITEWYTSGKRVEKLAHSATMGATKCYHQWYSSWNGINSYNYHIDSSWYVDFVQYIGALWYCNGWCWHACDSCDESFSRCIRPYRR